MEITQMDKKVTEKKQLEKKQAEKKVKQEHKEMKAAVVKVAKVADATPSFSSRHLLWLNIVLILLIILIVGGVTGYASSKINGVAGSISAISDKYAKAQQNTIEVKAALNQLQTKIQAQNSTIANQQKSLSQIKQQDSNMKWQLIEISHLIDLANYSLSFGQNPKAASELLNLVDQEIEQTTNNASLLALRQAIASDQAQLKKVQDLDASKIFIQLNQVNKGIVNLPLMGSTFSASTKKSQETVSEDVKANDWKEALLQSWQKIKSLVVVRKQEDSYVPLVAQEGNEYIFQYINLQLGEAQWALLHRDNDVYQQSLAQALVWMQRYFITNDADVASTIKSLQDLQAYDVGLGQVDLSDTLTALAQVTA
jgi:uroporphyrin-III C-methyltransferase